MFRLALKLALLSPLLIGMAWINWSVDPAIVFAEHATDPGRHPYEQIIAQDLLSGRPHRLKTPYTELLVDELIFRSRPEIDTLVLGNSVAKPIHEGLFGSPHFFNASVTGGRIEEMITAYQLALDCGLRPRHVLIEIDGRSLGQRGSVAPSKTLQEAFKRLHVPDETERAPIWPAIWHALVPTGFAADASKPVSPWSRCDELISPRYFQFTLAFVARRWLARSEKPHEVVSQFGESNEILLYPDGSFEWWANALAETPESIRQKFGELQTHSIASESYRPVPEKCALYDAFVADLLRSGLEVEFLLLPPYPWYFDQAQQEWTHTETKLPSIETEAFIHSLAGKYKTRVRGSLDPHHIGVTERDYIDDVHLRRDAVERLFKTGCNR
jgi:hypothetical protein